MAAMSVPNLVFILSDAYSGSTLLDLLLGSHKGIFSLGEVDARSFDAFLDENQTCTCLLNANECYFWNKVLQRLQPGKEKFRLGLSGDPGTIMQKTIDLYKAVQAVSGANTLVDSSKRVERTRLLAHAGEIHSNVIHLIRDGRGVAYSRMKRGEKFADAIDHWVRVNCEIREWLESSDAPKGIEIHYEDLCVNPQSTLVEIRQFLGIPREGKTFRIDNRIHHNVRGNPMRFTANKSKISVDEQWRFQLGKSELAFFADLARNSPQTFGYR